MGSVDQTASRLVRPEAAKPALGDAYLLVVQEGSSSIFHLPRTGEIVIGRAPEAELRIVHSSVSRRHATIRCDGGVLHVADLGSHNGTRVNGDPVTASQLVASGDVIAVGDVTLVAHFTAPRSVARQVYDETGWRRRLAEELERAAASGRPLAVVAFLD
ncbi:MAG TPA: FHA domain-containing protein, partial [Kofleriaceae bacterium]|nr:FHA domain-containing protein [Kofleriaceae bacterium]